jgi:predicted exporter
MIVLRVVTLPFKLGTKTGVVASKMGYRTARFVGLRRLVLLTAGVAIGLLVAPVTGRELRGKLRARLGGAEDGELTELVRFELSHSPKTWHLPQPAVAVRASTVVLSGAVPHETARADLERTASSVPGVTGVENLLVVSGTNGPA